MVGELEVNTLWPKRKPSREAFASHHLSRRHDKVAETKMQTIFCLLGADVGFETQSEREISESVGKYS